MLTLILTTFSSFWKLTKFSSLPMRTKWRASLRQSSPIQVQLLQCTVLKEKVMRWILSTVWQFTAVEFQIKNIILNFLTTTKEKLDSSQFPSILSPAHSQQDLDQQAADPEREIDDLLNLFIMMVHNHFYFCISIYSFFII